MNRQTFTPGEWFVIGHGRVATAAGEIIAQCFYNWAGNAWLVAAAPELYVALKRLAAEEYRDDDDPVLIAAREQARAAISKVED